MPKEDVRSPANNLIVWLIAIALLFPLFVQMSGGIYNDLLPIIDSRGLINKLPLPISLAACVIGLFVLRRNWHQASPAIVFVLAFSAAMVISTIFAGETFVIESQKVLLAAQFLLPTMALVLGQLVRDDEKIIPTTFLWGLLFFVPFQLFAGWSQKTLTLTHYLYAFSIYQHFQFVPIIFVTAYCLAMVNLWERDKNLLWVLTGVMAIYVLASASFLAIGLYIGFVGLFFMRKVISLKTGRWFGFLAFALGIVAVVVAMGFYFNVAKNNNSIIGDKGQYVGKFEKLAEGKVPVNVVERLGDWELYINGIGQNSRTLAFGHVAPPGREVKTSAHNWYLDCAYNFGLIALLPVFGLIFLTMYLAWRSRKSLSAETLWLAGIVAFLVLVDSNFKVTLRQPYPGIFSYFLWGLLLSRLHPRAAFRLGA